jgi:hypothetical protein
MLTAWNKILVIEYVSTDFTVHAVPARTVQKAMNITEAQQNSKSTVVTILPLVSTLKNFAGFPQNTPRNKQEL